METTNPHKKLFYLLPMYTFWILLVSFGLTVDNTIIKGVLKPYDKNYNLLANISESVDNSNLEYNLCNMWNNYQNISQIHIDIQKIGHFDHNYSYNFRSNSNIKIYVFLILEIFVSCIIVYLMFLIFISDITKIKIITFIYLLCIYIPIMIDIGMINKYQFDYTSNNYQSVINGTSWVIDLINNPNNIRDGLSIFDNMYTFIKNIDKYNNYFYYDKIFVSFETCSVSSFLVTSRIYSFFFKILSCIMSVLLIVYY